MGRSHDTHGEDEECMWDFYSGTFMGKDQSEDSDIDRKLLLEYIPHVMCKGLVGMNVAGDVDQ